MAIPMQITLRDIPESAAIESRLQQKIAKLQQFYDPIIFCRVTIEVPEKRQHQGKLFNVHIEINVPNKTLVVKRELHEDLYVAIREAFKDAVRQLEDFAQIRRGDVKHHAEFLVGRVIRLFPEGEYGFIETPYGEEYYFNAAQVLHTAFTEISIGDIVYFTEQVANDGLQATHIKLLEKRRPAH